MHYKKTKFTKQFIFLSFFISAMMATDLNAQSFPQPGDTIQRKLKEVEVQGSLGEAVENIFSSTTISGQTARESSPNGSINPIFDQVPSMITTSDAGTGIGYTYMRIRGVDQTRINVTMNGVAINDAESQGTWLVNLPDFGTHVTELNVQRGVGNSSNGSAAFGASMNFKTRTPETTPFLEIYSGAGSFSTFRNTITGATGYYKDRLATTFSYSNIYSKGYIQNATAKLNSFYLSSELKLNDPQKQSKRDHTLFFNLLTGSEKTGLAWNGVPSDMLETDRTFNSCGLYTENGEEKHYDNETDNYKQTHAQLFYRMLNKQTGYYLNIGTHLTRGLGYYEQFKVERKFADYGLTPPIIDGNTMKRSDFITQKWLDNYFYGLTFNTGQAYMIQGNPLRINLNGALNYYDGDHYGKIVWARYSQNIPELYEWYRGHGGKLQAHMALNGAYQMKGFTFFAEMQYRILDYKINGIDDDLIDVGQEYLWHFFNPKASLSYHWGDLRKSSAEHTIYFSFAMANKEPTRSDLIDAPQDNKPRPETLYDFELGYLLQTAKVRFNLNGYGMYYDDQLVLTGQINDVGAAMMSNVDQSYRMGVELNLAYSPVDFFQWKWNLTWSQNRILNYVHYTETYDENWEFIGVTAQEYTHTPISFSPALVLNHELLFTPFKNFNLGVVTKFVSKQYIDNRGDENHILKPYTVTNLNLSYLIPKIKKVNLSLYFSVNNVFNTKYESNAWLWRANVGNETYYEDGYFPQAGMNVFGGVRIRF